MEREARLFTKQEAHRPKAVCCTFLIGASKKFTFTFDHVNQKIVGTDVAFAKAGISDSALEKELVARMEARPTYGFTIIPTEKKPAKQSYKGLNFELMMDYVEIKGT